VKQTRGELMTEPIEIRFPLQGDNSVEIRVKNRMSARDFERVKELLNLASDGLVNEAIEEIPAPPAAG
jgi:hypothetical protein